ncbi:RAC family serine/threonine-protein kinase-like [Symbiodinium microadriaticum]|uniref:non-specific serine/threonine protein kinase n=1 Tax=Symbiodinium microadriaticum TaxID=2951 RepID=A0A1Q9CZ39_SYMMI|nr:RAC family serine/threonine-protein kinase-like [Symbiodinium microadriaticum]
MNMMMMVMMMMMMAIITAVITITSIIIVVAIVIVIATAIVVINVVTIIIMPVMVKITINTSMYAFVMELCTRGSLTDHIRELRRGLLAKLTDFGLCRFGTEATGDWTFGAPPGTPAYIAPEVIRGQSYGRAADLYSFGALIWLVLTGGLVAEGEPKIEPPCAQMAHKWDYSALAQNFKLIAACIQQPEENGARPLPSAEAEELVLDLTKEEATGRPSLEELRRYPALQPLRLPDPRAGAKEVDAWLACLAQRGCLSCGGQGCGLCRLDDSASQGKAGFMQKELAVVPMPGGNPACMVISQEYSDLVFHESRMFGGKSDNFQASDEHGHPSPPDRRMHDRHLRIDVPTDSLPCAEYVRIAEGIADCSSVFDKSFDFVVADPDSFESEVLGDFDGFLLGFGRKSFIPVRCWSANTSTRKQGLNAKTRAVKDSFIKKDLAIESAPVFADSFPALNLSCPVQDVTSDEVTHRRAQASEDVAPSEELEATASAGGQPELEKTRSAMTAAALRAGQMQELLGLDSSEEGGDSDDRFGSDVEPPVAALGFQPPARAKEVSTSESPPERRAKKPGGDPVLFTPRGASATASRAMRPTVSPARRR